MTSDPDPLPGHDADFDTEHDALDREHRAAIVDRLYDVAIDPIRLEDLVDAFEAAMAPVRHLLAKGATVEDRELQAHVHRASVFLDRYEATHPDDAPGGRRRSVLDEIPRVAAFIADGGPAILAHNHAAATGFGLPASARLDDLPFDPEDRATLRDAIRRVAGGHGERVVTLRIRSERTDGPVIVRVSQISPGAVNATGPPLSLVMSSELVWPEGFDLTVRDAFGLTAAEAEVVRALTVGQPVRDIARARGRSLETVRTQIRSILAKTETHSQGELARVVLGLMEVAAPVVQTPPPEAGPVAPAPDEVCTRSLRLPDGRRIDWLEFGAPHGAPLLYMHLDYALVRWPRAAERAARVRAIRVIVPVRAGYGRSSPLPAQADRTRACAEDYAAVLDHLRVSGATVVSLGADLRYGMQLSVDRPDLVSGIVGCSAQLPMTLPAHYDSMDKWQRFILANARYAPKLLPFLVKAGFSLARRMGKERFFELVNAGSPGDLRTFADPEVRQAILSGSDAALSGDHIANDAFAQEAISSERDWSSLVRDCPAQVVLLQGDQDPQAPLRTIRELAAGYPHLELHVLPGNGQLLFFHEWRRVLAEAARFLRPPPRASTHAHDFLTAARESPVA